MARVPDAARRLFINPRSTLTERLSCLKSDIGYALKMMLCGWQD